MRKFTQKSIKDSDIDLIRVEKRLSEIAKAISVNNKNNLTDINVICEEIFGQILNKLYNINLVSMSAEVSGNFIAVDLADYGNRIAYQVTSQNNRDKIRNTIKKFNDSGLYKQIDELYFLILCSDEHKYIGKETVIYLKNKKTFSYTKNIINFNKLICEIEKKNKIETGFIVDVYNCINMVYDSGRLKYFSIVNETELLMRTAIYNFDEKMTWLKGYGDIQLSAIIPLSYKGKLKSERIDVLKSTKNGNLFWKPDVYKLSQTIHKERVRQYHEILGGSTSQGYSAAVSLNIDIDEISEIYIFFHENDAIRKDFYNVCEVEIPDTLVRLEAPRFVVSLEDGKEYWIDGLTCGYIGEGPRGTEDILDYWGILEKTKENFKIIASSSILHIVRENGQWQFLGEESRFRYVEKYLSEELFDRIKVSLYSFNQKLILIQKNGYNTLHERINPISKEILFKYMDFIPQPVTVEFLAKEDAIQTGHYTVELKKMIVYQIVIKDITERELWIEYPFENIPKSNEQDMYELLEMLGMDVKDESFIEKARYWFGIKPRWVNRRYIRKDSFKKKDI